MHTRRLLLIRHAQAAAGPVDADRPLTERGARHAAAIESWLVRAGLVPDRVLVSPARRAMQTWERASAELGPGLAPVVDPRIYDNTVEALLTATRETCDDVGTLAVVGHNPSVAELAGVLDDAPGSPEARHDLDSGFPPGGVAVFTLATSFAATAPGAAMLAAFRVPGD